MEKETFQTCFMSHCNTDTKINQNIVEEETKDPYPYEHRQN